MMTLEAWLAFVIACFAMALIPGPGLLNVIGYAVSSGRRTALLSVAGMAAGDIVAMSLSLAGLGAILAASATAFGVLKLVGAAYLVFLGITTIRNASRHVHADANDQGPIGPRQALIGGFLISALHPKTIVFSVVFLPLFIDPQRNFLAQAILLVLTFGAVFACTQIVFAFAASAAEGFLKSRTARIYTGRIGGSILVASGVATAVMRKPN